MDFDGDGHDELIVRRPSFDPSDRTANDALGSVEIYCTQRRELLLLLNSRWPNDLFGFSAGSAGDITGDGFTDIVVGAPYALRIDDSREPAAMSVDDADDAARRDGETSNAARSVLPGDESRLSNEAAEGQADAWPHGRVDVFCGATGQLVRSLQHPQMYMLGRVVTGVGDVNGDGVPDIAASGYARDAQHNAHERVVVFCGLTSDAIRVFMPERTGDGFGHTIAGLGDLDGDGFADIAIGAPNAIADPQQNTRGVIHVFRGEPMPDVAEVLLSDEPITQARHANRHAFARIAAGDSLLEFGRHVLAGPMAAMRPDGSIIALDDIANENEADAELLRTMLVLSMRFDQATQQIAWLAETIDPLTGERISHAELPRFERGGDITRDLAVSERDLEALLTMLGNSPSSRDPFNADLNDDAAIDAHDLDRVTEHFGTRHQLLNLTANAGDAMAIVIEELNAHRRLSIANDQRCAQPIRTRAFPGVAVFCGDDAQWIGAMPPGVMPIAQRYDSYGATNSIADGEDPGYPDGFIGMCCHCCVDIPHGPPSPDCCDAVYALGCEHCHGGGGNDPGGEGGGGEDPGNQNPGGSNCPGDCDCDGIPDEFDCDHPSGPGTNDPCCDNGPPPTWPGGPYTPQHPQNEDDDCDGIPNWADCDSNCYIGNATADCACQDDNTDGIPNQNTCGHECAHPDLLCIKVMVDSNNDGTIDDEDRAIQHDEPSMIRPGKIVFVPHDPENDDPILAPLQLHIPADEGEWSLQYNSSLLTIHWNSDREAEEVGKVDGVAGEGDCSQVQRDAVVSDEWYCADSTPHTLWIEAKDVSATAGNLEISLHYRRVAGEEESSCQLEEASDFTRVTAATLEVHDLRHWGPVAPVDDVSPPTISNPDLDSTSITPAPKPEVPDTLVDGAITDGASICLVRIRPAVHGVDGLSVSIRRMDPQGNVLASHPMVVGTMNVVNRDYDPSQNSGNWSGSPAELPLLPTPNSLPGGVTSSADFDTGLAFFVPPEAYTDPLHYPAGAQHKLTSEETTEMNISVHLGTGSDSVAKQPFMLRRPPIILVHGLTGSGHLFGGVDQHDYWGNSVYNEVNHSPVPTRLYVVNYATRNMTGYDDKTRIVNEAISHAINQYRSGEDDSPRHAQIRGFNGQRYAATRVDTVGHSMGGQILRTYISTLDSTPYAPGAWPGSAQTRQSLDSPHPIWGTYYWSPLYYSRGTSGAYEYLRDQNWGAGDIRRLIAMGSPFKGSPIANFFEPLVHYHSPEARTFLDNMKDLGLIPTSLLALLWPNGIDYREPTAISDLSIGSTAQLNLENAARYPKHHRAVPWYPLVGIALQAPQDNFVVAVGMEILLEWAAMLAGVNTHFDEFEPLNPSNGDLIVSQWSQRNADDINDAPNSNFPHYEYHCHTFEFPGGQPVRETHSTLMGSHIDNGDGLLSVSELLGGPKSNLTQGELW